LTGGFGRRRISRYYNKISGLGDAAIRHNLSLNSAAKKPHCFANPSKRSQRAPRRNQESMV
jgi:hypothetical protein